MKKVYASKCVSHDSKSLWLATFLGGFTLEGAVFGEEGRSLMSGQFTVCSCTFSDSWEMSLSLSGRSGMSSSVPTTLESRSTEHRED